MERDAEGMRAGSAAIGRELGARRKFWALLLTHTLLSGACVASNIYFLLRPSDSTPMPEDKGIFLNWLPSSAPDRAFVLNFTVTWSHSLELFHANEVKVKYPGPYIFYICASVHEGKQGSKGSITLKQGENQVSIDLQDEKSAPSKRCVRHERLVSLYERDMVTFIFQKTEDSMFLKDLRVGLHYMLGDRYFQTPAAVL